MPDNKNQQSSSSCTPSNRRETVAIRDLPQTGGACATSSNRDSGSRHSYDLCTSDEVNCAPGTCCAKEHQCVSNSRPCPEPHLCTPPTPTTTIIPICKSPEVEAMIKEMKSCHEDLRSLAQKAMEMLHSEKECPMCKQEAQKKAIAIEKGPSEGPSKAKSLAIPSPRSCPRSKTSSVPIAQQAFQIKEGRLPKTDDMEVRSNQPNKEDSKNFFQKMFEKLSSANSSNERQLAERKKSDCTCSEHKDEMHKCQCHFPPSYNQYFTCTGHVSGHCNCDKNA